MFSYTGPPVQSPAHMLVVLFIELFIYHAGDFSM